MLVNALTTIVRMDKNKIDVSQNIFWIHLEQHESELMTELAFLVELSL